MHYDFNKVNNWATSNANYIDSYPRKILILLVFGIGLLWQSIAMLLALFQYIIFVRMLDLSKMVIGIVSVFVLLISIYLQQSASISAYIVQGFHFNFYFWELMIKHDVKHAIQFVFYNDRNYILGFSLFSVSMLSIIDLVCS